MQAAWQKATSSKTSQNLKPRELIKRPVLLGMSILVLFGILSGAGYWQRTHNLHYINASLRDSCGAHELLIGVRGSGETDNMHDGLGNVIGPLADRFISDMGSTPTAYDAVNYEAVSVDGITALQYDESYIHGVNQIYNSLYYWYHRCPNYRFVIAGYSQGADAAAAVLASLNPTPSPKNPVEPQIIDRIDGVALMADPKYNPNQYSINANPNATRPGMLWAFPSNHRGVRQNYPSRYNGRVRSWCRSDDPVCQVTDECKSYASLPWLWTINTCINSIKKNKANHTKYSSDGKTNDAAAWLASKSFHPSNPPVPSPMPPPSPLPQARPRTTPNPARAPAPSPAPRVNVAPTTPQTTVKKYNVPPLAPAPTPPAAPPPNRVAITSYDRMQPGAPHHGYFDVAWQNFVAQSNTITYLSATVGSPGGTAGVPVGVPLTIRLCTSPSCGTVLAQTSPQIVNYGETGSDIGDVHVTPGATYYIVWYQPAPINGKTWVTYWWAGGTTISTSDQLQAVARGYNK